MWVLGESPTQEEGMMAERTKGSSRRTRHLEEGCQWWAERGLGYLHTRALRTHQASVGHLVSVTTPRFCHPNTESQKQHRHVRVWLFPGNRYVKDQWTTPC